MCATSQQRDQASRWARESGAQSGVQADGPVSLELRAGSRQMGQGVWSSERGPGRWVSESGAQTGVQVEVGLGDLTA